MPWVIAVGAIAATAGAVGSGIAGAAAAGQQEGAAQAAALQSRKKLNAAYKAGSERVQQGIGALNQGYTSAQEALGQGIGAVQAAGEQGRTDIQGGLGESQSTLQGLIGQAAGQQNRVNQFYEEGFQADPGYQFRQQQGEQALGRLAAARGGRLGGRTFKEFAQFNQGLASQEAQNAFMRAQAADANTRAFFDQQAGLGSQLAGYQYGGGQALAGFGLQAAGQQAGLYNSQASLYGQQGQANLGAQQYLANFGYQNAQNQANAIMAPVQYAGGAARHIAGVFDQVHVGGQQLLSQGASKATGSV